MKIFTFLCLLLITLNGHTTTAQTDENNTQLSNAVNSQILLSSIASSVQITSRAVENASSARTLGKVRQGSGVVIGSDGLILTIGYLVLETEQIEIRTHQQKTYPAQVVAYDQATGFGLIKSLVPLQGVEPVKLGKLNDQKIDSSLLVVSSGNSAFTSPTKLIDVRSFTGYWEYHLDSAIFTSPPVVNHSGAGLFNAKGELIGIGSLFMQDVMPAGNPFGLAGNMFVPVELLEPILNNMLQNGMGPNSQRAWLGINAVERQGRIQIVRVTPESPAQLAGVVPGQWLLGLNGIPLESLSAFYKQLWAIPINSEPAKLTIFDGKEIYQIPVPVVDRSANIKKPAGI
jgi:S1-C subfamily serine protease